MMWALGLLLEYWWLVLWAALCVGAWVIGGWRLLLIVATLGGASIIYRAGWQGADKSRDAREHKRSEDLAEKYRTIDGRGTDRNAAADRLQRGDF